MKELLLSGDKFIDPYWEPEPAADILPTAITEAGTEVKTKPKLKSVDNYSEDF